MYKYGMRLRGFSLGCQPMDNFIKREDSHDNKYHDIICYSQPLTRKDLHNYSLDLLNANHEIVNTCNYCFETVFDNDIIFMSKWNDVNDIKKPCCPYCGSNDLTFDKQSKYHKGEKSK